MNLNREFDGVVALRMPNWLGDAIMASGVISSLKQRAPKVKIILVGYRAILDLFRADPRITEFYEVCKDRSLWEKIWVRRAQLSYKVDFVILLTNSLSSAWHARRAFKAPVVGFKRDGRTCILSKAIEFPKNYKAQHLVISYQVLLDEITQEVLEGKQAYPISSPELFLNKKQDEYRNFLRQKYQLGKYPIIGFNTQAAYGPAKCWPAERFTQLARRFLHETNAVCIFFGDQQGRADVDKIVDALDPKHDNPRVVNLAAKTKMQEFIAAIAACDLLITNDSGPMHLAAALKRPLVAIFGSTDDRVTGPYEIGQVINKRVECAPCFQRKCPIDFRCMNLITVDDVWEASLQQLESRL